MAKKHELRCPNGCRPTKPKHFVEDQWRCPKCGDESVICGRYDCHNPARLGEPFCTRHEDRETYEHYARASGLIR